MLFQIVQWSSERLRWNLSAVEPTEAIEGRNESDDSLHRHGVQPTDWDSRSRVKLLGWCGKVGECNKPEALLGGAKLKAGWLAWVAVVIGHCGGLSVQVTFPLTVFTSAYTTETALPSISRWPPPSPIQNDYKHCTLRLLVQFQFSQNIFVFSGSFAVDDRLFQLPWEDGQTEGPFVHGFLHPKWLLHSRQQQRESSALQVRVCAIFFNKLSRVFDASPPLRHSINFQAKSNCKFHRFVFRVKHYGNY